MTYFILSSLNSLYQFLAKSRSIAHFARLLRNQLNMIVNYYVGGTSCPETNGEYLLILTLAPSIHLFCDIGANIGDWSNKVIQNTGGSTNGFLFEPNLECFELLQKHFSGKNIYISESAVSNFCGITKFSQQENLGTSSALSDIYKSNCSSIEISVSVVTLDSIFADNNQVINLLKIDTEGNDLRVIEGSIDLMKSRRIEVIQFEFNHLWEYSGSTLSDAFRLLESYDFFVFILRGDGLYKYSIDKWGVVGYANFVAVRSDVVDRLNSLINENL
jgi:hypothetical protein